MFISALNPQLTRLRIVHVQTRLAPDSGRRQVCVCSMASGCGLPPHQIHKTALAQHQERCRYLSYSLHQRVHSGCWRDDGQMLASKSHASFVQESEGWAWLAHGTAAGIVHIKRV